LRLYQTTAVKTVPKAKLNSQENKNLSGNPAPRKRIVQKIPQRPNTMAITIAGCRNFAIENFLMDAFLVCPF
jgi:hypothetical protein